MNINKEAIYLLESIEDANGNQKLGKMYSEIRNCYCSSLCIKNHSSGKYLNFKILSDANNHLKFGSFHTSYIQETELNEEYCIFKTLNSSYVFKKVYITLDDLIHVEKKTNTIELWIKGTGSFFGMGYYWDSNAHKIPLDKNVHFGMFQDSVIISDHKFENDYCRYFIIDHSNEIKFYHHLYDDNRTLPNILIHNTTNEELIVSVEDMDCKWIINPNEQKYIRPEFAVDVN